MSDVTTEQPTSDPPTGDEEGTDGHEALEISGRLIAKNTLLNLGGQIVPIAAVVLAAPYLIAQLGEARTGILAVSMAILNFSPLLDLGFGRALRKRIAEVLGRGETSRVAPIATTALLSQLAVGLVGALLLAAITPPLADTWLQIPPDLQSEARATFALIAFALPLSVLIESLVGVLEAGQRFGLVNVIRVPFLLSESLLPLLGVHLGWTLDSIAGLMLGVTVVFVFAYAAACGWVFPDLLRRPRFDRTELTKLFGFGKWVMVSNAVSPALMYLDRLAIGALISMTAVTAYTAPFEAITRLSLVPAALAATLFPAFSALSGQGHHARLDRYALRAAGYLLVLLGPVVVLTMIFSRPILTSWIGADLAEDGALALTILAFGVLVNALAHVPYSLVQGRGRPDLTAKFHAIELPIHAVLVFAFVHWWGIPGAALAWTVRVTLDALLLFFASVSLSREAEAQERSARVTPEARESLETPSSASNAVSRTP